MHFGERNGNKIPRVSEVDKRKNWPEGGKQTTSFEKGQQQTTINEKD